MERRKYYIPKNEIYRAYDEHKAHNPSDFWFDSEFEEDENGNQDKISTQ